MKTVELEGDYDHNKLQNGKWESIKTDWAVSKPHACISNTRDPGEKVQETHPV